MADPLLHRLPLADPSSDSLGRLNGQYPALTYVDCADDVGVPLVAAHLTAEPIPGGTANHLVLAAPAMHSTLTGASLLFDMGWPSRQ